MSSAEGSAPERVPPDEIEISGTPASTARISEAFRERVAARRDDEWDGLSEEEIERWLSGTTASGVETDEADIDEILYGSPDEFEDDE